MWLNRVSYGYYLQWKFKHDLWLSLSGHVWDMWFFGYSDRSCRGCTEGLFAITKKDHLRRAENFYSSLRTNTLLAKLYPHIAHVTFNFRQNLPLSHMPMGEVFYTHRLWLYVLGVHEYGSNRANMYNWPEFIAGNGSNEVVSLVSG